MTRACARDGSDFVICHRSAPRELMGHRRVNHRKNKMAIVDVKVPQLSESVAEATLLQWKKKPGEAVAIDEILVEIETDKVVLEVPAPAAGVLAQLLKQDGESCVAEEVIAKIDTEAAASASPAAAAPAPPATPPPAARSSSPAPAASALSAPASASPAAPAPASAPAAGKAI